MNKIQRITDSRLPEIVWNDTCDIVYIHKNIVFHSEADPPFYTCDEYKYNSRDFIAQYLEQVRADLDYISMMAEVDL